MSLVVTKQANKHYDFNKFVTKTPSKVNNYKILIWCFSNKSNLKSFQSFGDPRSRNDLY